MYSHAGSSDLLLMFGCTTSNFMCLVFLSSLDGKDEQPKSTGFSNCTLVICLSFYSYLFIYLFIFAFSANSLFCWISDPTAKTVTVVTPVCLALVFNAVCLTKCLYAIHRLKKVCHPRNLQAILYRTSFNCRVIYHKSVIRFLKQCFGSILLSIPGCQNSSS